MRYGTLWCDKQNRITNRLLYQTELPRVSAGTVVGLEGRGRPGWIRRGGIADRIVAVAFAVATCPKCAERFRLVWRIGRRRLQPSARIRLTCPACVHSFTQVAVGLVVFSAGAEQFPKSVIVDRSALVED